jgi:hypothetical protein
MTTPKTHHSIAVLKLPVPVPALISMTTAVLGAMTNNASFPNPTPKIATVDAKLTELETAQTAARARTKGAVTIRDQKRAELIVLLAQLKAYVQTVADADSVNSATLIESAGMTVKKVSVRAKHVFSIKEGAVSGSVKVVTASGGHRASYDWETSIDGGKTWQLAPSTMQAKTAFTGLAPGSTLMVRYRVLTKAGEGDWSQPLPFIVK